MDISRFPDIYLRLARNRGTAVAKLIRGVWLRHAALSAIGGLLWSAARAEALWCIEAIYFCSFAPFPCLSF